MPLNSQTGPLAMPCTLPLAVSVTWKIFEEAPPAAASPAGAAAGGVGAWAAAWEVTAAAARAAPEISTVRRSDATPRPDSGILESLDMLPPRQLSLPRRSDLAARPPIYVAKLRRGAYLRSILPTGDLAPDCRLSITCLRRDFSRSSTLSASAAVRPMKTESIARPLSATRV